MGAFDEGPLADPEHHEQIPHLIKVQERHVVHPSPDLNKLKRCRDAIVSIVELIEQQKFIRNMLRYDAHIVMVKLRVSLGEPKKNQHLWEKLELGNRVRYTPKVYFGTWAEAVHLHLEWQTLDDLSTPVSARILTLQERLRRCKSIQSELESNIEHWGGV